MELDTRRNKSCPTTSVLGGHSGKTPFTATRTRTASRRILDLHRGGKISVESRLALADTGILAMVYTPGVAHITEIIHKNPARVYDLTIKGRSVAIVTDGTAVLGLGDVGPCAALPVMEGKAMLFKRFGGVDAFPICLNTKSVDGIVAAVKAIAPGFGGINLEDISAPRCFEIEDRLTRELNIPVFHDDQHGTAIVVLAALMNALKLVKKDIRRIRVVISGVGAAGVATARLLLLHGCREIVGCDSTGAIYRGRARNMNPVKQWFAVHTNPRCERGALRHALVGSDVFIGLSVGNILDGRDVRQMAQDSIVFALANPTPEIAPHEAARFARIVATGRSDHPNQINNVLCFPGLFRGLLECRARHVTTAMKVAAARAIADTESSRELREDHIIPSVFDDRVAPAVAAAVVRCRTGHSDS